VLQEGADSDRPESCQPQATRTHTCEWTGAQSSTALPIRCILYDN
jgi:hypothetical protein